MARVDRLRLAGAVAASADAVAASLAGSAGGSAAAAVQGFVPGPKGLEGGVVNSSRGILFPAGAKGAEDAATWEQAFDGALDSAIDELGDAIRR